MRFLFIFLLLLSVPAQAAEKTAIFAGGCFWCMESEYEDLAGVIDVVSGFTGGDAESANYEAVSRGNTNHREAVRVTYDPEKISYAKLLDIFWENVDPFDEEGQFCDKGTQYTAAIYVHDESEQALAEDSLKKIEAHHQKKVATIITGIMPFYPADAEHQDFYRKDAARYQRYRAGCGRDKRLKALSN